MLFFFLLLVDCPIARGQFSVYHPFPDSNAYWCSTGFVGGGDCEYFMSSFATDGHIQLNGFQYIQLAHYEISERWICSHGVNSFLWSRNIDTTMYYLREDTVNHKSWIKKGLSVPETTFYDLNVQVGDTLDSSNVPGAVVPNDIVTSIDSVLIGGNYRKRVNCNYGGCTFTGLDTSFIEGIGATQGLTYPHGCFESEFLLSQFRENDSIVIDNSAFSNGFFVCQMPTGMVSDPEKFKACLSPNPFKENATLAISQKNLPLVFTLCDLVGHVIWVQIVRESTTIIHRNSLPDGLYIYQLTNDEGPVASGKLIVN